MADIKKARIAYDGPAINDGKMDVRELAPALIAFSDLISDINKTLGGERDIKVMLNQDSIQKGSFDITFILDQSFLEQAKLLWDVAADTSLDDIMKVLGYYVTAKEVIDDSAKGIFWLIKRIKDRAITNIKKKSEGKAEIYLNDDIIEVDEKILKVYLDVNCRLSIERMIKPLDTEGINKFEIRDPGCKDTKEAIESIEKKDVALFKAPAPADNAEKDLPVAVPQELLVKIVSVNFESGKWRFSDNSNPSFWATMADERFNAKVEKREIAFSSGDMLRIKYRHVQSFKNGNLTSEYIVDEVIEFKAAPRQIKLDFEYKEQ